MKSDFYKNQYKIGLDPLIDGLDKFDLSNGYLEGC